MDRIGHWIDGAAFPGGLARTGPVWNPATGVQQAEVSLGGASEVGAAVEAAAIAFPKWRATPLSRRTEVLFNFREALSANRRNLAALVTSEHGKTVTDALGEVARGLENVEYACGALNLLKGEYSEQVSTGIDVYSIRQPLGVVAGITPFNFPAMVPLWMLANAIACGNTFVLKPSEKDPSASLLLGRLLDEAGLPPGVFNVVHGDKEAVDALLAHPQVSAVSFVGSTPVAKAVYTAGTGAGKRVQALGGAKNHMVVLPDADVDLAADAAVSAGFGSSGERCMAVSVVVAVGAIAQPLVDAIAARIQKLRVGDGSDPDSDMGPLITADHRDRVASYLDIGRSEGAELVVDGRTHDMPGRGFFLGPSLLDHVQSDMAVYQDEIFGPVLTVARVDSYDQALQLVNSNRYGNGTAIFTRDGGAVQSFQYDCQVGMVGVNVPVPVPVASYSFGGWKESLFGDSHIYGPDGIRFYTRTKVVTSRWPGVGTSRVDLGFPGTR
ncbi:MAG: CoA-acylating methylmalonate-semialdehyde dehydrogenase [Actinomycetota bacterium]|nr:CoA-acylating methylmalonate-semialdehyde dehydrogenase [Actinomycetota bacterium]